MFAILDKKEEGQVCKECAKWYNEYNNSEMRNWSTITKILAQRNKEFGGDQDPGEAHLFNDQISDLDYVVAKGHDTNVYKRYSEI